MPWFYFVSIPIAFIALLSVFSYSDKVNYWKHFSKLHYLDVIFIVIIPLMPLVNTIVVMSMICGIVLGFLKGLLCLRGS